MSHAVAAKFIVVRVHEVCVVVLSPSIAVPSAWTCREVSLVISLPAEIFELRATFGCHASVSCRLTSEAR